MFSREGGSPVWVPAFAVPSAVRLDILPGGGSEDSPQWLASYTDEEGTTKFRFELGEEGKFLSQTGSNPLPLLGALKKALNLKRIPQNVQQSDVLPFEYEVIAKDQTRSPDGSFTSTPKGNWETLKVSVANGKGEVYLNLDVTNHQGEFSAKDVTHGDIVLAELARVF